VLQLSGPEFRLPKQPSAYFQDRQAILDGERVKLFAHRNLLFARHIIKYAGVSRAMQILIAGQVPELKTIHPYKQCCERVWRDIW
jgi:hypothetical protein